MNESINDKAVYRTAPASPGLLIMEHGFKSTTKKSRIHETKNFLTNADSRTDTILKKLLDLFWGWGEVG